MAKYRNGKAHEQSIVAEGDYVVINSKFVSTGGVVEKFSSRQLEPLYKNEIAFVLSDIPNGKALSKTFLVDVDQKYTLNQRIAAITPKESASFLNELLNRNSYFLKFDNGVGQTNLAKDQVLEFNAFFPSLPEQEAISTFFSTLDQHITLHQRKLDKLKSVKQAYLSEMFPAEGERVPKRRFPGFTDDWELRKLRNIFHNIENAFVGIATPHYVSDGRFYLESNNIKDGQVNYETKVFISEEFYQRQKNKWLRAGDIVMVQSGHVGHSAVIPEELDCSAAHALIMFRKQKVKISSNFLNYQFQTKQSKIKLDLITTGNTIKHILSSEMKEFNANFPSHPEQETIGTFFSTLDRHITLHQRKSI